METAPVHDVVAAALRGDLVIDVRNADEYAAGHVPDSVFMPLTTVPLRLSELDRAQPVFVVCESGARAFQACQYLSQYGYLPVLMSGGMVAYRAAGLPVRTGPPAQP